MSVAATATKVDVEYTIKPEAVTPAVDTSTWPLLLKDYDKCRSSSHSTSCSTSSSSSSRVFGLNCCFLLEMVEGRRLMQGSCTQYSCAPVISRLFRMEVRRSSAT